MAFERHAQPLTLGRLPHQHAQAAQGWILAKLVIAMLLETLSRLESIEADLRTASGATLPMLFAEIRLIA